MKILLVGEYSGVHKNLKEGLIESGHQVLIASTGDGWKKIENNINWDSNYNGLLGKLETQYRVFKSLPQLQGFDVVQFISPNLCVKAMGFNAFVIDRIIKQNRKSFLIGAGCNDCFTADFLQYKFRKKQLFQELSKKSNGQVWFQKPRGRAFTKHLFNNIDGYVPLMYEYAQGAREAGYKKMCPTIPLPLNVDKIQYQENRIKGKVIFLHGLTRENVKGTPLIRQAMENLASKYPNDVKIIIDGKMPLNDYLKILQNVNVVIDQAYSISYGMNVAYNLALGKVVVGGGEAECLREFGLKESPLIPINPTVENIELKLSKLLENRREIPEMGWRSRKYVEEIHNYKKIADRYVDVWQNFPKADANDK